MSEFDMVVIIVGGVLFYIVSLYAAYNYGAMLQCKIYAARWEEILKEHDTEFLRRKHQEDNDRGLIRE